MNDIKYTPEDIDRIYNERVYSSGHVASIKKVLLWNGCSYILTVKILPLEIIVVMLLMCIVDGIHVLIHRNWDASLSNGFSKEVVEARDIVREYLKG